MYTLTAQLEGLRISPLDPITSNKLRLGFGTEADYLDCGRVDIYWEWIENQADQDETRLHIAAIKRRKRKRKTPKPFYEFNEVITPGNERYYQRLTLQSVRERLKEVRFCIVETFLAHWQSNFLFAFIELFLQFSLLLEEGGIYRITSFLEDRPGDFKRTPNPPAYIRIKPSDHLGLVKENIEGTLCMKLVSMDNQLGRGREVRQWSVGEWNTFTERKVFAITMRSNSLPPIIAMSGYAPQQESCPNLSIAGEVYTSKMLDIWKEQGFKSLEADPRMDRGREGSFYASHAEMLLMAHILERHRGVGASDWEASVDVARSVSLKFCRMLVTREPCVNCQLFIRWARKKYDIRVEVTYPDSSNTRFICITY